MKKRLLVCFAALCLLVPDWSVGAELTGGNSKQSPVDTLRRIKSAIAGRDLQAFYQELATVPWGMTYEEFERETKPDLENFWREQGYLRNAEEVRVEPVIVARANDGTELAHILCEWKKERLVGRLKFVSRGSLWKWVPPVKGTDDLRMFDFRTIESAWATLRAACNASDVYVVYHGLAKQVVQTNSLEQYEALLRKQTSDLGVKTVHNLNYGLTDIEPEYAPDNQTVETCRVWKLDHRKQRVGSEIFIKESNEWKWLPDDTTLWNPASWQSVNKLQDGPLRRPVPSTPRP